MIKTSIIVPVYNMAPYLKECFDSIFSQTQKEIEVIAINDGSTDNSLAILKEIKKKYPELIVFSQINQGLGAARNQGLDLATGEFVYFIDSDDCLMNEAMEICYHYAKTNHVDIVMFDAGIFGEIGATGYNYDRTGIINEQYKVMDGKEYAKKYWLRNFSPSACLIYTSAAFLKKHSFRFTPRIFYEDNEFHTRIIPSAKLIYLPQMLYRRRIRENSIILSEFDQRHANDFLQMMQLIEEQAHSEEIKTIINELEKLWVNSLLQRCMKNELLKEAEFVWQFYQMARKVYGSNVEQIEQYHDINVLFQLSEALGVKTVSDEIGKEIQKIQHRRRELLKNFGERSFLAKEGNLVGIYGTGKKTEELLAEYRRNIGEIKADIVFIESQVKSGQKQYMGFHVINIDDIGEMQLDCILITSVKYEKQMKKNIRERYREIYKVLVWKSDMRLEE